ncbi:MAG: sigma 54-dependent Fis family transcriptional regulator [Deltaproteobacteria bacterium]|nr:sigma 54-dependent Fis family transcriptional regulator [Deltaproteobacteria bacterium]
MTPRLRARAALRSFVVMSAFEQPGKTISLLLERGDEETSPLPGCTIHVVLGASAGARLELPGGSAVIGRGRGCDLVLDDRRVSSRHLRIDVAEDGFLVTDLGSKNGTFYLETRVERAVLPLGSTLRVGDTRLLLASRYQSASETHSALDHYGKLIGTSPAMRRLYALLEKLERIDYATLILGETGVGKELVAREIHAHSQRGLGPFEVCDCAALTPTLVESELFGHRRGAFTGADSDYRGAFQRADGGTIFLDEIGELPLELQPKLLRALESHQVRPVGSSKTVSVDTRVIAATNRDLGAAVESGRFRKDLFFRLNAVTVTVPPLRERREDIPVLVGVLLEEMGHREVAIAPATLELFITGHVWPGNVRELRNALARFRATGREPVGFGEDSEVRTEIAGDGRAPPPFQDEKRRVLEGFERDYLVRQLELADNNISQAARASGLERTQFKRLLRKHGII